MYTTTHEEAATGLSSPERNQYFHGKLLDAYHFNLETAYHQKMRRLLNRLVLGYGVVCGLDVRPGLNKAGESRRLLQVSDGFALDRWGHEIVVPADSATIEITDEHVAEARAMAGTEGEEPCEACRGDHKGQWVDDDQSVCVHVVLCYRECQENPMPVMAGDCSGSGLCVPGTIREWYCLEVRPGHLREPNLSCGVVDAVTGKAMNYTQLVRWVTFGGADPDDPAGCPQAEDPCIPLANVRIPDVARAVEPDDIDIYIRPIVYPNDLLFEMFLDLVTGRGQARMRKS